MIKHDQRWSLSHGNTPVPSRWQATLNDSCGGQHMSRSVSQAVQEFHQCEPGRRGFGSACPLAAAPACRPRIEHFAW